MTDQAQRSLIGYKSKIHEQGEFENLNEGKPLLTEIDEYILRLRSFPRVISQTQLKENKDGTRKTITVDKAVCEFEEQGTKNIVTVFFRVDSLNFSEDDAYESAIIRFFRKIQHPLKEGAEPNWEDYFIVGMRFRARVVVGKDAEKKPNGKYYLDVSTCRPLLQSDKEDTATISPSQQKPDGTLTNALLLAKGAKNKDEAYFKLVESKTPVEIIQEFLSADKAGKVTYPI